MFFSSDAKFSSSSGKGVSLFSIVVIALFISFLSAFLADLMYFIAVVASFRFACMEAALFSIASILF